MRATTSGQPDLRSILISDMRKNTARIVSLLERRNLLGTLKGDRLFVENVSIKMDLDASDESQAVLKRLAKRFE